MEIVLVKEKETPGTWRFKENKEDHPMTIYLTKEQVKELGSPESIKVTIMAAQRAELKLPTVTILHFLADCDPGQFATAVYTNHLNSQNHAINMQERVISYLLTGP